MQTTTSDLIIALPDVREGNRYFIAVTGATVAVVLEFQHQKNGAWFAHPQFNATPVGGVIFSDVACFNSRMRLRAASGQGTPWTATCVRHVTDSF